MNERIKDAWEKAAHAHSGDSWAEQTAFLEKFAELVVQECANICNKIYFDRYPDAEDWERSEEGDAIKKHFGVEL